MSRYKFVSSNTVFGIQCEIWDGEHFIGRYGQLASNRYWCSPRVGADVEATFTHAEQPINIIIGRWETALKNLSAKEIIVEVL